MLIKVFGEWLNFNNITNISKIDTSGKCIIRFVGGGRSDGIFPSKDEVAQDINRQISQSPKIGK